VPTFPDRGCCVITATDLRTTKKEYPKSVTELLILEEKRFPQGVCYFKNNIPIFISNTYVRKEKEVMYKTLIVYSYIYVKIYIY
jgi:hypothetical protein